MPGYPAIDRAGLRSNGFPIVGFEKPALPPIDSGRTPIANCRSYHCNQIFAQPLRVGRCRRNRDDVQGTGERFGQLQRRVAEHRVLVRKVPIERRTRNTHSRRDVIDTDSWISALTERDCRRCRDLRLAILRAPLDGIGPRLPNNPTRRLRVDELLARAHRLPHSPAFTLEVPRSACPADENQHKHDSEDSHTFFSTLRFFRQITAGETPFDHDIQLRPGASRRAPHREFRLTKRCPKPPTMGRVTARSSVPTAAKQSA